MDAVPQGQLGRAFLSVRALLIVWAWLIFSTAAIAGQLTLAWDPVSSASGYKVYYGTSSTNYSSSIDAKASTTYTLSGLTDGAIYYFAVTAYSSAGIESSYSSPVSGVVPTASNTAPAANFTATPTSGVAPLAVTLTDTSTGSITSRSWNLGDGTTATSQTVAKSYTNPGTYTVTLTVTGSGGSTTKSQTVSVTAAAPVANFTATPSIGVAPATISFTDTSSGSITSWAWQFGDGGTSTAKNPSYTYATAGTYSVSLTVAGSGGSNKTTKSGLITISAPTVNGGTPSTPTTVAPTGLVAAFGFEEASGSKVIDASGNGNHGIISGATRVKTAQFGNAIRFDGVSSWITVEDSPSLDISRAMTIEAWVYPTSSKGAWRTVLMKEQPGDGTYFLYANSGSNRPEAVVFVNGDERVLAGPSRLPVNAWSHLSATYDGLTERLYVNGALVATKPQAGAIAVSNGKLRIGGNAVWGEYFAGYLDEIRIYNRALTDAEILADSKRAVVGLMLSTAADRSNPVPLNGASASGNVYIFYSLISPTATTNPVKQVKFWLDDPKPTSPTGTPRQIEITSPFDFAGTLSNNTASPLNTSGLAKGAHTITAQVILSDGTTLPPITGTFTVQ